jgi:hypothetical protein
MALTASERIVVLLRCQHCGRGTEQGLNWLIKHNWMLCPTCGRRVDLENGDNGLLIQTLSHYAAAMEPALAKLGESRWNFARST